MSLPATLMRPTIPATAGATSAAAPMVAIHPPSTDIHEVAAGRTKIEVLIDERADLLVGDLPGAERLDVERDRTRDPDHVRDLYLEPIGEPGLHDVLRDVARRVRGGTIDLRRVFAAERAAAVT